MDTNISIQFGHKVPDDNLKKAALILGFDPKDMSYTRSLRPTGLSHISGTKGDEFRSLCGIGDISGFWEFSHSEDFNGNQGCLNCKRRIKADNH